MMQRLSTHFTINISCFEAFLVFSKKYLNWNQYWALPQNNLWCIFASTPTCCTPDVHRHFPLTISHILRSCDVKRYCKTSRMNRSKAFRDNILENSCHYDICEITVNVLVIQNSFFLSPSPLFLNNTA